MTRLDRIEKGIEALQKSQLKTDRQLALTDAQLAKTDAQLAKTDAQLAKTDAQLAKTDAQLARTDAQLALLIARQEKSDEQLAKTDAQLARTDAQLALLIARQEKSDEQLSETKRIVSGIGINLGDAAEDFFAHSLQENKVLGDVHFDSITFGLHSQKGAVQDEFDIVMYNGDSVAIIEVKHKVHPADLENLLKKKLPNFRALFPRFADMQCYLGLAGMSVPRSVLEKAEKSGVAVLRQKGKVLVMNKELKAF